MPPRPGGGQGRTLFLVNPPVVAHAAGGSSAPSYLKLMVGGTPRSNYFSIPAEALGLLSIKSYAAAKGLAVTIVNGIVDEHRHPAETLAAIRDAVGPDGPPALVGFSQILAFDQSVWLARECKRLWPDVRTLFGHDFATLNWQRILRDYPEVDYACVGEGEAVFEQLARRLLEERPVDAIPGLAYRDARGAPACTPSALLDLDDLPWPARDELERVRALGFSAAVFASRGCPYRCAFCTTGQATEAVGRGGYRSRSVELIAEEMYALWRHHGCDFINIADDLFLTPSVASRRRAEEFARALIRRGYRGQFMLDARVDSIEHDVLKLLREAGLARLFVGVESGSLTLLDSLNKRYALRGSTIAQRLATAVELGIEVIPGIIAFHPTVQPGELRATLHVMELTNFRAPNMLMSPMIVFPGTTLHETYRRAGYLTREWPVALWRFADPRAERAYREIAAAVHAGIAGDFAALSARIRRILDEWEADVGDDDRRPAQE
jgi:radical SAM superfamily enzyme YgiQ (UPF0313 family)